MPYYTMNDGSTRNMPFDELNQLEKTSNLRAVIYHSVTPATYKVKFENGDVGEFTRKGARIYAAVNNTKVESGLPTIFCKHDLYAGYNPALGCEISGKSEYNRLLKEKGLVEIGNETKYRDQPNNEKGFKLSESDIREAVQMGASISDNEGSALISGDL